MFALARMASCSLRPADVGLAGDRLAVDGQDRVAGLAGRPSTAGLSSGRAQFGVPSSQTCPASSPVCTIGTWQASSRPAGLGARPGSTQSGTRASVVVDSGTPKPTRTTVKNSTARIRLWNGPANITMTRCHQGLA